MKQPNGGPKQRKILAQRAKGAGEESTSLPPFPSFLAQCTVPNGSPNGCRMAAAQKGELPFYVLAPEE